MSDNKNSKKKHLREGQEHVDQFKPVEPLPTNPQPNKAPSQPKENPSESHGGDKD